MNHYQQAIEIVGGWYKFDDVMCKFAQLHPADFLRSCPDFKYKPVPKGSALYMEVLNQLKRLLPASHNTQQEYCFEFAKLHPLSFLRVMDPVKYAAKEKITKVMIDFHYPGLAVNTIALSMDDFKKCLDAVNDASWINGIKTVRTIANAGLWEAKHFCDLVREGTISMDIFRQNPTAHLCVK
jgi:hypothetical protein